jgi:hypothetical protein
MKNWFTEHPNSIGESYWVHLGVAGGFGCRMIVAGVACFAHALLPFVFKNTGSKMICCLHDEMKTRFYVTKHNP